LHAVRKDLEEGEPFRAAYRRGAARWLDSTNVGGVADEVAARTRRADGLWSACSKFK
jgi:hypothetical protein